MADQDHAQEAAPAHAQRSKAPADFARSAGDWLLGGDPERLIGVGRLVTASLAIVAIYLDPTRPVSLLYESRLILSLYVFLSVLLVVYPLHKSFDSPVHLIVHAVDVIVLGWLTMLTNELLSPFFAVLPFVLLAMTMRWGLKGAAMGVMALLVVHLAVGLPDLLDGESELNVFIMRSTYFVFSAVVLGYFGAYRERSRERLAELAEWPFETIAFDRISWLKLLFRHASRVLGQAPLLVVWRDQEDDVGSVAYWAEGQVTLVDIQDTDFWRRHDPLPQRWRGEQDSSSKAKEEPLELMAALPQVPSLQARDLHYYCSASFSTVRYRGRVFVINPDCRPDEGSALTEIIATRVGSELERLALMQQTTEAARSEERMRLARDLHDSVLQNLTAARLKLKLLSASIRSDDGLQLDEVGMLIFEQQQRLRQFVEDNRAVEEPHSVRLEQTLEGFLGMLREQWDCQIAVSVVPPDIVVPKWMMHEIKQLVSEATANAVRHGKASRLRITIGEADNRLRLEIVDDGSGMSGDEKLQKPSSLSARVAKLGGELMVYRSAPGFGIDILLPATVEPR